MSEIVLDRGVYFPSPFTDWYRERSFRIAFVISLLIHASLLALIPALRAVRIEPPQVMSVELIVPEQPQVLQPVQPVPRTVQRPPEPIVEPIPEPEVIPPPPVTTPPPPQRAIEETLLRPEPRIEPRPEPVIRQPEPVAPVLPRTEVVQPLPRPEPRPEPIVVQRPEPRPEPRVEPRTEIRPEPQVVPRIEPVPVPPPPPVVARPQVEPVIERPAPPPPIAAVRPPPVASPAPPPAVAPPAPVAAVQPPPAPVARAEPARNPAIEEQLKQSYGQSISQEIRRYQKYPPVAQRRGWEGTAEVLLKISADGKVAGITLGKSSGRPVLDDEALAMVRRATPLPQAPADLRGRELTVTVPIVFKLQS